MFWKNKKDEAATATPSDVAPVEPAGPETLPEQVAPAVEQPSVAQTMQQVGQPPADQQPAAQQPSPDPGQNQQNRPADAATVLGEIVALLLRTPKYREYSIADLEWLVIPALRNNQFALARTKHPETGRPVTVGVAFWAMVDEETDRQLLAGEDAPVRLPPDKWKTGDIVWLVDAIGPQAAIQGTLARLVGNELAGKEVRLAALDGEGRRSVRNLRAA